MKRLKRLKKRAENAATVGSDGDISLERMRRANRALGYAEFVKQNAGEEPTADYHEAMRKAARAYGEGGAGYGQTGEALAGAGLSGSGYAAYLDDENERTRKETEAAADRERREGELALERSYGEYLAKHARGQESRMTTAVRTLLSDNFADAEDAYRYALSIGLEDGRAETVREMSAAYGADGYRDASLSARIAMLNYISRSHMGYEEAYRYALALGAPEETAERIARYAESSGDALADWADGF